MYMCIFFFCRNPRLLQTFRFAVVAHRFCEPSGVAVSHRLHPDKDSRILFCQADSPFAVGNPHKILVQAAELGSFCVDLESRKFFLSGLPCSGTWLVVFDNGGPRQEYEKISLETHFHEPYISHDLFDLWVSAPIPRFTKFFD